MINVLLVCSAGMSTSLLVEKVKTEAKGRNIDIQISAIGEAEARSHPLNIDVMLLGPQVRYLEKSIRAMIESKGRNIAMGTVEMVAYSTMNGSKVLDQIIVLNEEKK